MLDAGVVRVQPIPADLRELVRVAAGTFAEKAESRGLKVDLELDAPVPLARCDPQRVLQVLVNFFDTR